ncbi:MAG: rod shape-determining protein MreC [Armatimonadota bacterium]
MITALLLLVVGLGWWQASARRANARTPVDQLIMEILAPSLRAAGAVRNQFTTDQTTPMTSVGAAEYRELQDENRRLTELLHLKNRVRTTAVAAEVIGWVNTPWEGSLILGKGEADGIEPRMVVLTPEGVVGSIYTVTAHTAEVLPLTDPSNSGGIGAMTARTKAVGVLKGIGNGQCRIAYLSGEADVKEGDMVLTSGLGPIFPRGLPLGTVTKVERDTTISSRVAVVKPAADPSMVKWVVVVK